MKSGELRFIEELGLLVEKSAGSRTLGRVLGYLLLADRPRNLDQISRDLLFSKATASLTVRQGQAIGIFEKVSIPGERRAYYQAATRNLINVLRNKTKSIREWQRLIDYGLGSVSPHNRKATENLQGLKDYLDFVDWYLADIDEQYKRWRRGEIFRNTPKTVKDG
jgi:DNA-binding transcriptional regulator GbsR (MarR family)